MQFWVYLTLPEVKHTGEAVKQLPRNLLPLPPLEIKRYTFLFSCIPTNAPQNTPETWKHPKHRPALAENSAHTSLLSPPFTNWACEHCREAQEFMRTYTFYGDKQEKKMAVIKYDTMRYINLNLQ